MLPVRNLVAILSRTSVLLSASALLLAFQLFAFPTMGAILDEHTPAGGEFDLAFFYTPEQAMRKASLFGEADGKAFVMAHWTYDLAFPLAYGLFAASAWAFGLRLLAASARPARGPRLSLVAIPLAAAAFDLCENAAVSLLLASYTVSGPAGFAARASAAAASAFTPLKWLAVVPALAGAILLPAAGLIAVALAARRR